MHSEVFLGLHDWKYFLVDKVFSNIFASIYDFAYNRLKITIYHVKLFFGCTTLNNDKALCPALYKDVRCAGPEWMER